jgi:nucleotide-binding universal stress UspA family protein
MIAKPKINRILFATDFLGCSRLALDYAAAFASMGETRLAVTVVGTTIAKARVSSNELLRSSLLFSLSRDTRER